VTDLVVGLESAQGYPHICRPPESTIQISVCHVWNPDTTFVLGILLEHFILHVSKNRPSKSLWLSRERLAFLLDSDKFDRRVAPSQWSAPSSTWSVLFPLPKLMVKYPKLETCQVIRCNPLPRDSDRRPRYLELRRLLLAWPGGRSCNCMVNLGYLSKI